MGRADWSSKELQLLDVLCEGDEPVAYALHTIPNRDQARSWLTRLVIENMLQILSNGAPLARNPAIQLLWTDHAWAYRDGNPILHVTDAGRSALRRNDPNLLRMVAAQRACPPANSPDSRSST